MKQLLLLLSVFFLTASTSATIRRVGYTGTPVANIDFAYNNLYAAINAANPGDTIQVYQQLATTASSVDLYKPVKIFGFGHTLNVNTGNQIVNTKDSNNNAISITFNQGSAGSVIAGLNLSSVNIYDSNITVTRCRFKYGYTTSYWNACGTSSPFLYPNSSAQINLYPYYRNLTNITINGNYFDVPLNNNYAINGTSGGSYIITNLQITNNFFSGGVNLFTGVNGQINGVFANNIVNFKFQKLYNIYNWSGNTCTQGFLVNYPAYTGYSMSCVFDYFLVKNNIINTEDTVTCPMTVTNCVVQNNVFSWASQYTCTSLSNINNVFKANMNTVFGAAWNNGFVYNDNQLALGASSAAINAGVKGDNTPTNCGVFGGEVGQSYKLSGLPPLPSFYLLNTPGVNASSNPFNITISVKSNN